jgi:hypothetical protein
MLIAATKTDAEFFRNLARARDAIAAWRRPLVEGLPPRRER